MVEKAIAERVRNRREMIIVRGEGRSGEDGRERMKGLYDAQPATCLKLWHS